MKPMKSLYPMIVVAQVPISKIRLDLSLPPDTEVKNLDASHDGLELISPRVFIFHLAAIDKQIAKGPSSLCEQRCFLVFSRTT